LVTLLGIISVNFDVNRSPTYQIFCIRQLNESIMGQNISYLQTLRSPMTQSREKYYTIFSLNFVFLWNKLG